MISQSQFIRRKQMQVELKKNIRLTKCDEYSTFLDWNFYT